MKALSVRAPWWWYLLHGYKPVENRSRQWNIRGTIALHASAWWNLTQIRLDNVAAESMAADSGLEIEKPLNWADVRAAGGCLVGTIQIVDCVSTHSSPFFTGPHALVVRNPVVFLKPVPFRGAQGFFDVPNAVIEKALAPVAKSVTVQACERRPAHAKSRYNYTGSVQPCPQCGCMVVDTPARWYEHRQRIHHAL